MNLSTSHMLSANVHPMPYYGAADERGHLLPRNLSAPVPFVGRRFHITLDNVGMVGDAHKDTPDEYQAVVTDRLWVNEEGYPEEAVGYGKTPAEAIDDALLIAQTIDAYPCPWWPVHFDMGHPYYMASV